MLKILTERTAWTKPRPTDKVRHSSDLTPEEQANVKSALQALSIRFGTTVELAKAMNALVATVRYAMSK
jgi:hypothetical protein